MTEQMEISEGAEPRMLRELETGEEIVVYWTDAELYEHMRDDMVIEYQDRECEQVFKDRSYFDFNRNRHSRGVPMIQSWTRPLQSDGAGCHPSQVKEFNEKAKSAGFTGVSFTPDGTCNFSTRGQRAKYLKHIGMHDRNGGYGD